MAKKKPNILVLWGDDVGWWNISYNSRGQMGYRTPNIDRIGNEGVAKRAAEWTASKDGLSQSKRPASPKQSRQSQQSLRSEQSSEDMLISTRSKKRRPFKEIDEEEDKHSSQG